MSVLERRWRCSTRHARRDRARDIVTRLFSRGCEARHIASPPSLTRGRVPDGEHPRVTGHTQVRTHRDATGGIARYTNHRPAGEATTPAAQNTVRAAMRSPPILTPIASIAST